MKITILKVTTVVVAVSGGRADGGSGIDVAIRDVGVLGDAVFAFSHNVTTRRFLTLFLLT